MASKTKTRSQVATTEMQCPVCEVSGKEIGNARGTVVYQCPQCELCFLPKSVRPNTSLDNAWYADLVHGRAEWAEAFVEQMREPYRQQLQILEGLVSGKRLLDVGSGVGVFLKVAQDQGWHATGVEESPHAIEYSRKHYGVSILKSLGEIPDGSQDVVRLSHVLEHVPEPKPFLRELSRVLAKGGILYLLVPNREPLCEMAVNHVRKIFFKKPALAGSIYPDMHVLGFSLKSLANLVATAGFKPVTSFTRSMGDSTYYPMFYDGLLRKKSIREIPLAQWPKYYVPCLANRLGDSFGLGSWIIGFYRQR